MKLWFFRTPKGIYGVSEFEIGKIAMAAIDGTTPVKAPGNLLLLGANDYRVDPRVKPGECVPVELAVVKKARKE